MIIKKYQSRFLITAFSTLSLLPAAAISAEDSDNLLPEIRVTSQKRDESLSDVPISVKVVSAQEIQRANINKIADLTEFVPNLSMTETGVSTQMYIRGIGSGNNEAFEQSVGQYVDGIYYGRQQLIRSPFLDLERVEVLRGPQGVIFGKNSIAGALNLSTARPGDETEVILSSLYEFKSEQQEYTAVISGPLSDSLGARLAFRGLQEEGYVENTFLNRDEPQRDESTVRLTLDWQVNDKLSSSLKIEQNSFDTIGRQIEILRDDPNLIPAGLSPIAGLNYSQILTAFGQSGMDGQIDFKRQADAQDYSFTDMNNLTLTVDYQLGDNTFTSISGWLDYEFDEQCDCDYTPANILRVNFQEEYDQFSQEFRLSSPGDQALQWMLGAYYQHTEMESIGSVTFPGTHNLISALAQSGDPSLAPLAVIPGTLARRDNYHDSEAWAIFAQASWEIRPSLTLTLGARYTEEDKEATRLLDILDEASGNVTANPATPVVYLGAFNIHSRQIAGYEPFPGMVLPGHSLAGKRSESSFTPVINLEWQVTNQSMLYASASTGFKAGGFDARANNPLSFEFEDEEATSFEIGSKSVFSDMGLELNAALFFTDYQDLQVSQFDGTLGFNVGNAKKTEVWGLEVDGRWAIDSHLALNYSLAYLDYEFKDFTNGNCYNRQAPDGDVVNGISLCDYSGLSGKYTPELRTSLALDYNRSLGNGLDVFSTLSWNHVGEQNVHENLDPLVNIDAYNLINFRIGIAGDHWMAAILGKNLGDEEVLTYAGNAPVSASTFGTNTFYGFVDRPRTIALELQLQL